jgi:Caspase domain
MTTRRQLLKTLAALPPALAMPGSLAQSLAPTADPSRLALVIGNNAYKDNPLDNPVNDARGMSGLFTQAGFTVDALLNAKRDDMLGAIDRFGTSVNQREIKLVVFYYAGHGVQLDWQNYLLPVDATVASAADIKARCIGLNGMLAQLGKAKDKTFIVILDACRNNPFGRAFRMPQQGLSQFDAPTNSLLAYATAPGNVAADGSATNGLYTENLIKELSIKGTRFEDALKRVRTSVRIASGGTQVPWESTSLESDVFLFKNAEKKLSGTEIEAVIEAEFTIWAKIKSSRNLDDLATYLRTYPDGRFSEVVQYRVAEILNEGQKRTERQAMPGILPSQPSSPPPSPSTALSSPAIHIAPGKSVQILLPADNPYSAGTFPLNRIYSVGDNAAFKQSELLTNVVERTYNLRVTAVDREAGTVELNNGERILDPMGNMIKDADLTLGNTLPIVPAQLQVGRKWKGAANRMPVYQILMFDYQMEVVKREKVSVPAGEFDSFLILAKGFNPSHSLTGEIKIWVVPGLNFYVKFEEFIMTRNRMYRQAFRLELMSLQQQIFKPPVIG